MMDMVRDEAFKHATGEEKTKTEKHWYDTFKFKDFDKWYKSHISYANLVKDFTGEEKGWEWLHASVMVSPIQNFFAGATFLLNLNDYNNHHYQPDFTYTIGYSDWRPDTFGFLYSNYANNKFYPHKDDSRFHFDEGTWEVNYKTKIDQWRLQAAYRYVPFVNRKTLKFSASSMLYNKVLFSATWDHYLNYPQERLTLSGKTFLYDKFFVSGSAYLYSDLAAQTDLEPDYAYSFGWHDHEPYHISVIYTNYYMATRWWWRDLNNRPIFDDGLLLVEMNLKH